MTQVVKCLPSKYKTLIQTSALARDRTEREREKVAVPISQVDFKANNIHSKK
jgi:hypothetical protein